MGWLSYLFGYVFRVPITDLVPALAAEVRRP